MFLYFNGCSYTHGKGCEDRKKQRFSTLVSDRLGADHYNDSKSGSSNDGIVYRTFNWMQNNTCDYAIIMMTHAARIDLSLRIMPGELHNTPEEVRQKCRLFYENFYNEQVGAVNFYKNRYLLEQLFEKRGIPLLLFQYCPFPDQESNPFKTMCKGDLPLVSKTFWNNFELSPNIQTILGRRKNKEFYWSEKDKRTIGHFNYKGHEKVADWIIDKLTPTI